MVSLPVKQQKYNQQFRFVWLIKKISILSHHMHNARQFAYWIISMEFQLPSSFLLKERMRKKRKTLSMCCIQHRLFQSGKVFVNVKKIGNDIEQKQKIFRLLIRLSRFFFSSNLRPSVILFKTGTITLCYLRMSFVTSSLFFTWMTLGQLLIDLAFIVKLAKKAKDTNDEMKKKKNKKRQNR